MKRPIAVLAAAAIVVTLSGCVPPDSTGSTGGSTTTSDETPEEETPEEEPAVTMTRESGASCWRGSGLPRLLGVFAPRPHRPLSVKYGDGFSKKDATFAVDYLKIDYKKQAAQAAEDYLDYSHFSCNGLIQQLESKYGDQYTHAQAVYGAKSWHLLIAPIG